MSFKSGFTNEYDTVRWTMAPGPLRKAAGFRYQEFSNLAKPIGLKDDPFKAGTENQVSVWAEMLIPEGAQPLAFYDHPFFGRYPAITQNHFGSGTLTYEGTVLSDKLQEKVLLSVLRVAGLTGPDQELPAQVLTELSRRIQRLRPDEPDPVNQLRDNLKRVMNFVLAERELTDILLNHSVGFDRDLDLRILEFYERIADAIQRSLDLGVQMNLVRPCDTRVAAYCILGGIKEVVGQIARRRPRDIDSLVEEILAFGLGGVARQELLEEARRRGELQASARIVFGPKVE